MVPFILSIFLLRVPIGSLTAYILFFKALNIFIIAHLKSLLILTTVSSLGLFLLIKFSFGYRLTFSVFKKIVYRTMWMLYC